MINQRNIIDLLKLPQDKLNNYVTCQICGGEYKELGVHLKKHNTNSKEYQLEFNAPTCSEALRVSKSLMNHESGFKYIEFDKARLIARELKLKSFLEWINYYKGKNLLQGIPTNPDRVYKDDWVSWGDWLGTGSIDTQNKRFNFLPFEDARRKVQSLNLKNTIQYNKWHKENRPGDLPAAPNKFYKDDWISWGDYMGTGNIQFKKLGENFLNYIAAKKYVRSLNLKNRDDWRKWHKENRPGDLPIDLEAYYKKKGWVSWGDFMGKENNRKS